MNKQQLIDKIAAEASMSKAQAEEFRHEHLQRVGLEIDQEEQEFLFRASQHSRPSGSGGALAGPACHGPVGGVQVFVGPGKGRQQEFKFWKR